MPFMHKSSQGINGYGEKDRVFQCFLFCVFSLRGDPDRQTSFPPFSPLGFPLVGRDVNALTPLLHFDCERNHHGFVA